MATKIQTPAPNKNIQFQLNANTFARTGYSFLGWNTNWEATSAQYEDNANATFSSDTDLYAIWRINQYTATFDANGGTGGTSVTQDYGTALTAPSVSREGYTFLSWNPEVPATMPAENKTYTAQWE